MLMKQFFSNARTITPRCQLQYNETTVTSRWW